MALSRRTLIGLTLAGTVALAGCSSTAGLPQGTVVIDVRTPAEYAGGHLEGATNIDVQATTFASKIVKLDNTPHFVYCHSGNRAGQAITAMKAVGLTNLTNGGGITDAAQTSGLKIVT